MPSGRETYGDAASLSWHRLGDVERPADVYSEMVGFLGFDAGYVAFGNSDDGPWVSFSADGSDWSLHVFSEEVCPGNRAARFGVGAEDDRSALILGSIAVGSADPCTYMGRLAAWRSDDGQHWEVTRADNLTFSPEWPNPEALWRTASGWQSDLGQSTTGSEWLEIDLPVDPPRATVDGFTAPDGTVVLWTFSDDNPRSALYAGTDGETWRPIPYPPGCKATEILAPPSGAARDAWVLFSIDDPTTCVSADLEDWSTGRVDAPDQCGIRDWADTRFGLIATFDVVALGAECDGPHLYISPDGLAWASLPALEHPRSIVDGPAGVIGLDGFTDGPLTAWRLAP